MSDLISRADAIEALQSRQTEVWEDVDIEYNEGIETALCEINALPSAEASQNLAEPNKELKGSDLIRREDAIHILACEMYAEAQAEGYEVGSVEDYIPEAKAWMSDAPSAEAVQGEWIDYVGKDLGIEGQWLRDDGKTVFVQCDQCDSIFVRNLMTHMNFCPNCGARMRGEEE